MSSLSSPLRDAWIEVASVAVSLPGRVRIGEEDAHERAADEADAEKARMALAALSCQVSRAVEVAAKIYGVGATKGQAGDNRSTGLRKPPEVHRERQPNRYGYPQTSPNVDAQLISISINVGGQDQVRVAAEIPRICGNAVPREHWGD